MIILSFQARLCHGLCWTRVSLHSGCRVAGVAAEGSAQSGIEPGRCQANNRQTQLSDCTDTIPWRGMWVILGSFYIRQTKSHEKEYSAIGHIFNRGRTHIWRLIVCSWVETLISVWSKTKFHDRFGFSDLWLCPVLFGPKRGQSDVIWRPRRQVKVVFVSKPGHQHQPIAPSAPARRWNSP